MKQLGELLLPLHGMLVHHKVTHPSPPPPTLYHWFPFTHLGPVVRKTRDGQVPALHLWHIPDKYVIVSQKNGEEITAIIFGKNCTQIRIALFKKEIMFNLCFYWVNVYQGRTKYNITMWLFHDCFPQKLLINAAFYQCVHVVPENIHSTPTEGICRMTPLPSGVLEISPTNLSPLPPEFPKFWQTPCNITIFDWNEKILWQFFFTSMPNFVSYVFFVEFYFTLSIQQISKFLVGSSHKQIVEKFLGHTQIKCQVMSEI